jgi:hypothetical protein
MRRKRSAAMLVIAILHLVFGGLGLLVSACAGSVAAIEASARPPTTAPGKVGPGVNTFQNRQDVLEAECEQRLPGFKVLKLGMIGFDVVLSILLIVAGIGLLVVQRWAQVLSVVYAILSIVQNTGYIFLQLAIVVPSIEAVARNQTVFSPPGYLAGMRVGAFAPVIFNALYLSYPCIVLIFMFLPSFRAAFRGEWRPKAKPRDSWEPPRDDWDERIRDREEDYRDRWR